VVDLVRRLHAQASDGQTLGPLYVEGLSVTLASYVYAHFGAERISNPPQGPGLSTTQRERLVALIEDRIAEPLHLTELAAEVGYSQDHFLRLFSASFGLSPHRYVIGRRVERAKSMLKDHGCSLVTVAFACGFSSQAHFSTVFKLHAGVTPGRYRNDGLAESSPFASKERPANDADLVREDGEARGAEAVGLVALPSTSPVPGGACPATLGAKLSAATGR
jgi:AraC family transcriptional regulator